MGKYEDEIYGKVNVVHEEGLIDTYISKMRDEILRTRVAGLDLIKNKHFETTPKLLIIFVGSRCLIIQLYRLKRIPDSLKKLIADETICFIGDGLKFYSSYFCSNDFLIEGKIRSNTGVELTEIVARVKPHLENHPAFSLASEVGFRVEIFSPIHMSPEPDWSSNVFSKKEIVYVIQDTSASYIIGKEVLCMLKILA